MLEKVIYAVDFGDLQPLAVPCLARLRDAGCSELVFLHVADEKRSLRGVPALLRDEVRSCLKEAVERKIGEWVQTCNHNEISVRTVLEEGDAQWTDLYETVRQEQASLVVLGPRPGPDAGPTTYFLMHAVRAALLILKVRDPSQPMPFGEECSGLFSRVLIPTDWSECALRAEKSAIQLRNAGIKGVVLVHVMAPDLSGAGREKHEALASKRLARSRAELEKAGIEATTLLLEGDPAPAIASAAESEDATLIMMGSTGKSVTEDMLIGSISEHVALTASRSVLLVH